VQFLARSVPILSFCLLLLNSFYLPSVTCITPSWGSALRLRWRGRDGDRVLAVGARRVVAHPAAVEPAVAAAGALKLGHQHSSKSSSIMAFLRLAENRGFPYSASKKPTSVISRNFSFPYFSRALLIDSISIGNTACDLKVLISGPPAQYAGGSLR